MGSRAGPHTEDSGIAALTVSSTDGQQHGRSAARTGALGGAARVFRVDSWEKRRVQAAAVCFSKLGTSLTITGKYKVKLMS